MLNGYTRVASEDISSNVDSWLLEQLRKLREFLEGLQVNKPVKPTLLASSVSKESRMGLETRTKQYVNTMPSGVEN